jgi:NADH-quinone oxidoreductase subunit M
LKKKIMESQLLLALLGIPALGAIVVALMGSGRVRAIRWVSLGATALTLILALILAGQFMALERNPPSDGFQPEFVPGAVADPANPHKKHQTTWHLLRFGNQGTRGDGQIKLPPAIQFYIGLDGINVWLVVLTTVLLVSSVLVSWTSITLRVPEFHAWLLALGTGMIGVFLAFDIILFYVFFELTLVPLFFLIGIWGGPERRHAARKFFIFTLAGSLITFLGILAVVLYCYLHPDIKRLTFSIPDLVSIVNGRLADLSRNPELFGAELAGWKTFQMWVFLALMVGFAIKVPLVPVHTWLPLAHVEAPTAGSVLLAGVLLKIGVYGFLRLCLPLAPDASITLGIPLIGTLAVIGIIYGALCSLAQDDIKKLVAYSSVSHLGFCMLGMFALNAAGLSGGLLQMINHGLSTGALFLLVGMLYDRYHTRKIGDYGGMGARLGLLSCAMIFICLTSIGLPGLNGFVGEALVFFGMFEVRRGLAIVGTAGILLGAWYLLTMVLRVFCGPLKEPGHDGHGPVEDLSLRELAALAPIVGLCFLLGIYPQPILNASKRDIDVVVNIVQTRKTAEILPERAAGLILADPAGINPAARVADADE